LSDHILSELRKRREHAPAAHDRSVMAACAAGLEDMQRIGLVSAAGPTSGVQAQARRRRSSP